MSKLTNKLRKYYTKSQVEFNQNGIIQHYIRSQKKEPKAKANYLGVEIECYGEINRVNLQKMFFTSDLEDYVMISDDGSIEPTDGVWDDDNDCWKDYNTFELRLLLPQKNFGAILNKFQKVFTKAKLKTNESCGLHVHLDMRYRNVEKCYQRLLRFENALFALVRPDRWNNEFCKRNDMVDVFDSKDRHVGVNYQSYAKHKTIEIRIHHATLNTKSIAIWIKLLLSVIDCKWVPKVESKQDVLKWKGLNKNLKGYVYRNFKDDWFERKEDFNY